MFKGNDCTAVNTEFRENVPKYAQNRNEITEYAGVRVSVGPWGASPMGGRAGAFQRETRARV